MNFPNESEKLNAGDYSAYSGMTNASYPSGVNPIPYYQPPNTQYNQDNYPAAYSGATHSPYPPNINPYPNNQPQNNQYHHQGDPNPPSAETGNSDLLPYRDDDDAVPLVPSAPMEPPPGYPNVGFIDGYVSPPPKYEDINIYLPKQRPEIKGTSMITEEDARGALLTLCQSKRCWGSKAAKDMNILNMRTTIAFQYCLESFCEKRTTTWTSTPYLGQPLDTAQNGYPPMPWDIPLYFNEKFKSEKKSVEVPHTACVKECNMCQVRGYLRCNHCHGWGRTNCVFCHGHGHKMGHQSHSERCFTCNGTGKKRCNWCSGSGRIRCKACQGHCYMKWFIQLTAQWTNNTSDFVLKETDLPEDLVKGVSGDIAFQEENVRVFPISHSPQPSINKASADLIAKHASAYPNDKILLQRQTVKLVPVTETEAQWKDTKFTFFVYGLEKKVYTENYPQTKCCGCSIL